MTQQIVLGVQGMTCTGCAQRLQAAVRRLDGVHAAVADPGSGRLTVVLDPDRADRAGIAARVTQAGFTPISDLPTDVPTDGNASTDLSTMEAGHDAPRS